MTNHPDQPGDLTVEVVGNPAPQGSKSYVGHRGGKAILVESSKAVRPWRDSVSRAVRSAMQRDGRTNATGPVSVIMAFFLPRPVSAPARRFWPDRRPDLDKLIRAVLDALTTGGAVEDDARVVRIVATKEYAQTWVGVRITVAPVDADSALADNHTSTPAF